MLAAVFLCSRKCFVQMQSKKLISANAYISKNA